MRPLTTSAGLAEAEAPKKRKRKQKATPSSRRRALRRLDTQIEDTTQLRHENWQEGGQPFRTERLTSDLDGLYARKRGSDDERPGANPSVRETSSTAVRGGHHGRS